MNKSEFGKPFTDEELKIHETLIEYDKARKAEGYAIAYRRWASYRSVADRTGKESGSHVETMYLNSTTGKALLVKVQPDGSVAAFEAVA
jgi:hypothetical protein